MRDQPGCELCLGRTGRALQLAQPWSRRAPWLNRLAPATRELMQAVQVRPAIWRRVGCHCLLSACLSCLFARLHALSSCLPHTAVCLPAACLQAASSAAVADLDLPAAAWRCTPKALLALGLLAEEAARREVAARFGLQLPQPPKG